MGKTNKIWSKQEINKLKELSVVYSDEEVAKILNRTKKSIEFKRQSLGLSKVNSPPRKHLAKDHLWDYQKGKALSDQQLKNPQ